VEAKMKPTNETYPTIAQSVGITVLLIVSMRLLRPIHSALAGPLGTEPAMVVYYLLAVGLPFCIAYAIRKHVTGERSFTLSTNDKRIFTPITLTTLALLFGVIAPLGTLVPMPDSVKHTFRALADQRGAFAFVVMVVAAPIMEELIFRGIILDGLLKKYVPVRSILISSLLFGFAHLNPWQFISAFIIGIFSGWIYYRTRSLSPCIMIHAIANLSGFLVPFFVDKDAIFEDTIVTMYGGIINLILVVAGSAIAIWICLSFLRKAFAQHDLQSEHRQEFERQGPIESR
jgi:membrane protease YdiL (CAAX protease family)